MSASRPLVLTAIGACWLVCTACGQDAKPLEGRPEAGVADGASTDSVADQSDSSEVDDGAGDSIASSDAEPDGSDDAEAAGPISFCDGPTRLLYDPLGSGELQLWPDDRLTLIDPASPTGLRLDVSVQKAPWAWAVSSFLAPSFDEFGWLSGFAHNGAVIMRFSAPIDEGPQTPQESLTSNALLLVDLSTDPISRVPYELTLHDQGRDLFVQPLVPLRKGARHAVILTTEYADANGGCIAPSETQKALLTGTSPDTTFAGMPEAYQAALDSSGIAPGQVSGMTVFTTHDDIEVLREAVAVAKTTHTPWKERLGCTPEAGLRRCEVVFRSQDFRTGRFIETATPKSSWDIPATVWLPSSGQGPFPIVLFGHGFGNTRAEGAEVAQVVAQSGMAVIAADAMRHHEHPSALSQDSKIWRIQFLGLSIMGLSASFDPLAFRGNADQTVLDRLQLVDMIRRDPDVDADGVADLDIDHMMYWGISMGAVLGPSLVAVDEQVGAGVFSVGGGRLATFVIETPDIQPVLPLLVQTVGGQAVFDRMLVVVQTLLDGSDPATYAPHVVFDRLSGSLSAPDVLFPVVINDDQVSTTASRALARALGTPHIQPVTETVSLLDVVAAPVRHNVANGHATAGYFQFDRITAGAGVVEATHGNGPLSQEGSLQALHFLETWLQDGRGEIVDPYAQLETPPL